MTFWTTYHGPTDRTGARISVAWHDQRTGLLRRQILGYDYAARDAHDSAIQKVCRELEWSGTLLRTPQTIARDGGPGWIYIDATTHHRIEIAAVCEAAGPHIGVSG